MTAALLFVAVLLLVGVALRVRFRLFQRLYVPASVLAGFIGLLIIQIGAKQEWAATTDWSSSMRGWPGWLIAVVFAGMLLERKPSSFRESLSRVGREGLMVWVIALGQTAIGLLITWIIVQRLQPDVPNSFGMLIETGFAGGHGTAGAMGQVFAHPTIELSGGQDLGILMATCGLVYGLISGIVWVNLGTRAGWVQTPKPAATGPAATGPAAARPTVANSDAVQSTTSNPVPIGYARIGGDTIDPLLLQMIWLALAFAVGLGLQWMATWTAGIVESWASESWASESWASAASDPTSSQDELSKRLGLQAMVGSFPLFIYTLFGGLVVRRVLHACGLDRAIDRETINRLTSTAMDILVVSAIATLNLTAVATLLVPFATLFVGGAIWSGLCLLVFARWLLPREHWFELGLINYGMSTGTTATGFVLLRLVDPELESGAAEDYALAAPLSSPFVGGGMITVGLPLLVLERFPIGMTACGLSVLVMVLLVIGRSWNSRTVQKEE